MIKSFNEYNGTHCPNCGADNQYTERPEYYHNWVVIECYCPQCEIGYEEQYGLVGIIIRGDEDIEFWED